MKNKELNLTKKEKNIHFYKGGFTLGQLFVLVIGASAMLCGLLLIIFGMIGEYVFIPINVFKEANEAISNAVGFGLNLLWIGVIVLLIGSVVVALSLNISSHVEEREKEKKLRKNERILAFKEARKENNITIDTTATVIDSTSEEKK